ncbi:MAG: ABC transporter ATP-binding protein [Planctomycetes bacterium]|nr:ABC transporter ATP-binding protein [Planctomycetota bacterium]
MIRCENLTRYFGSFVAVDRLTIEIGRGAVCALVGPNGAGKSTTMKMLCTLMAPTRGRAWIGGRDVQQDKVGVRQLIGYLPESFQLYEDLSVERYLQFFARAYNLDASMANERVTDYLERLGLNEKRDARVGTLSRGMRQRLGVAKSFLHDPEVVFLDEPASGLDPVARAELRDFLKFQQHLGKTVVVSSHVLKELADFCDHIAIVQNGRLAEFGPLSGAEGVLARYSGTAQGGRRYSLRVVKDGPRLEILLKELPGVSNVERRDVTLTFDLAGDEEAAAGVLTKVAGAGFLVARFSPEEVDLESVYRQASKGERSD